MKIKPIASISLDLDNQWSYMKTHGDEDWKNYPSYYDIFVPYVLDILKELDIKITFFIVGRDAVEPQNKIALKRISDEGHDFGNHSFNHEVWINQYNTEQLHEELGKAEKAILEATGKKTVGFRGPGFSWNNTILETLVDRQYLYDATTLPSFIGPFARMYYFWKSDFSKDERRKRKSLFGSFSEGFRRMKPYLFIRIPFHMSYLIYINNVSPLLMKAYLHFAIFLCKLTRTPVSFLLHPLDIIGGDKIKELAFFPGMNVESEKKIEVFKNVIEILKRNFNLVDMNRHAVSIIDNQKK